MTFSPGVPESFGNLPLGPLMLFIRLMAPVWVSTFCCLLDYDNLDFWLYLMFLAAFISFTEPRVYGAWAANKFK